ncbi:MAG: hypothetical protein AB1499_08840 [Nitrospirota bacterium]
MNRKYIYIAAVLFLLAGCASSNTLRVQDEMQKYSSSKKIYIETGAEVVSLSSRLDSALNRKGLLTTRTKKDADYVMIFNYSARFDVNPWVFLSFDLTMTDAGSGEVLYKVTIDDMKPEPVNTFMTKIVDDITARKRMKDVGLLIKAKE